MLPQRVQPTQVGTRGETVRATPNGESPDSSPSDNGDDVGLRDDPRRDTPSYIRRSRVPNRDRWEPRLNQMLLSSLGSTVRSQTLQLGVTLPVSACPRVCRRRELCRTMRCMGGVRDLGVMGTFSSLDHIATTRLPKRLNGKIFALFHFGFIVVLDQSDSMDLVPIDQMTTQVCDRFHWKMFGKQKKARVWLRLTRQDLSSNLNLVGFHCFLDGRGNIAKAYVDKWSKRSAESE